MPITADDLYLFNEGTHGRLYEMLGAHVGARDGHAGTEFAVWAPNAVDVSVIGNFNAWQSGEHPLEPIADSGIWGGFVQGVGHGEAYKYAIRPRHGRPADKADPLAAYAEHPPATASRVWQHRYDWADDRWMGERADRHAPDRPIAIYELHSGSWKRVPEENNRPLTYREIAESLPDHLRSGGFNFVEFMPLMEHPYDASWGYQTTGYFAPTSRFGTPEDLMFLVDTLHRQEIGVIFDWVPSHFPMDGHGLALFDGTHLFEHADPRQGFHPDWKSAIFNYGRREVRSFLLSSASLWLDRFHVDGLRVDAVASMLYLDYSREEGGWIPNEHGGNENLEAIEFLQQLNESVHDRFPAVRTYAEESTAWPGVTSPTSEGGLGFDFKWDMGWMHDTLGYFSRDPVHRHHHHNDLTFRSIYGFSERFTLALSHDEVVHGKASLLHKMPGDRWQQFANLRLLYTMMYTLPGKKLLFMGDEFGQPGEWNHAGSLEWPALLGDDHSGLLRLVGDLGRLYQDTPALFRTDHDEAGFRWVVGDDHTNSVFAFLRFDANSADPVLVVLNATPVPRESYVVGVPMDGCWEQALNSDATVYGGSGLGTASVPTAAAEPAHGWDFSIALALPPLGGLVMRPRAEPE